MIAYHSAMKKYGGIAKSENKRDLKKYKSDSALVFQHDICEKDIPEEFFEADCVFVVMSWRHGYKKFTENTIAEGTTFDEYCEGIRRAITALKVPAFVVTNRTFCKRLQAERYERIRFDRFMSDDICAIWGYDGDIPDNTTELMKMIGSKWETVLDFCCGYGETMYYARKCILTDVNTGCIDYIRGLLYGKDGQTPN